MKDYIKIGNPADCCGCGGCVSVCAKDAISMKEDEAGFIFPEVDESLCVRCGRCADVCVFTRKNEGAGGEPKVYAAATKDEPVLMVSSSGGIFTELAKAVLARGGAVFGAAWTDGCSVAHICVENEAELERLRGSKYVQSRTGDTFRQAKKILKEGRPVCYSGTPCQIAGLKAFLGKDPGDLLTVDLVCHGVPSMKMLRDDLTVFSEKNNKKISDISGVKFRDKNYGWGVKGSVTAGDRKLKYNAGTSPYYFYFLKGEVYRESCYNCRFPSEGRQGDITLGDYWGISRETLSNMGGADPDKGISCVLVNTENGEKWFEKIRENILITQSDRRSAEKRNKQLTVASVPLPEHKELLDGYIKNGYSSFRNGYKKHTKDHVVRTVKNMLPAKVKRAVNDVIGKLKK
ncbi:MAG: Coenzyme F420 hydrogenase/dehydrogenase, beta subunit C-terminal domain [Clostridia bacterium]|nr:Coenzyme F420 hydrogenase/dehydrogenase, beta subunit C-terminal domain [Clostridia bacterium]